jgi:hypothetical protein
MVLFASVHLAFALHTSDFGWDCYGLVYTTAGTLRSKCILRSAISPIVTSAHCPYSAYIREMLLWAVVLRRACAERLILVSLLRPFLLDAKLNDTNCIMVSCSYNVLKNTGANNVKKE